MTTTVSFTLTDEVETFLLDLYHDTHSPAADPHLMKADNYRDQVKHITTTEDLYKAVIAGFVPQDYAAVDLYTIGWAMSSNLSYDEWLDDGSLTGQHDASAVYFADDQQYASQTPGYHVGFAIFRDGLSR